MRVLILSANTGGGHNSAAKAVGEALVEKGAEFDLQDCLAFLSNAASKAISGGHVYLYKHFPRLFGWGYRFEENHSARVVYNSMALGAKRLCAYIKENPCDAIVCTHLFAAVMVTQARRKYGLTLPDYFVSTDYSCYPGMDTVEPHVCFVPHESLRQVYADACTPMERVIASGIPISLSFRERLSQQEARRNLGLPGSGRIVLLSFGSIGCGSIQKMGPEFADKLPQDTTLVIICGNNMRAYRQLKEVANDRLVVVGFTKRIAEYMAAADVGVGKPGGLSTTEMLAMGLPMVLLLAVPGCETHNMSFFENLQIAVGCTTWDAAQEATIALLQQPERLAEMQRRMSDRPYGLGAQTIADYIVQENEQK